MSKSTRLTAPTPQEWLGGFRVAEESENGSGNGQGITVDSFETVSVRDKMSGQERAAHVQAIGGIREKILAASP